MSKKPIKTVQIDEDLHYECKILAALSNMLLKDWIAKVLQEQVDSAKEQKLQEAKRRKSERN